MGERIERGTIPPGFTTRAVAWRRMLGGEIAVLLPLPRYDGTQKCDGDERFTWDGPWGDEDLVDMRRMCAACPFLATCRDVALAHERWFFFAGMTPIQRATLRREMGLQLVDRIAHELYGLGARDAVA